MSEESLAQLVDTQGQPIKDLVSQAGTIDVGGGQAVLVTADAARGVLDSLINMSGTILADSAVQEGGRIVLLARGGNVEVSGELSATGTTGGQIDVLGDQVHLASTAKLNADGVNGGGTLHIGGAYQGSGDTYRAEETDIDAGATLQASASTRGEGGEVVVWSDGKTVYEGSILARGGKEAGDGGQVEVSGKQSLLFNGLVDAGAANGRAGSLLLDPYNFTIGMSEAGIIDRVLRTGTSTSVSADNNIYVNYAIDGRGRYAGGGLTLSAGHDIDVNDYIITNNGAINLFAGAGTVTVAPDKVVYAGTAPITVRTGADLYNASYLTEGRLSLISTQGSVFISQGIDATIGNLLLDAALDVNITEPIVSLSDGDDVEVNANRDININAQINGSDGTAGGTVALDAGRDVNINEHIVTYNGAISIDAGGTVIQLADGTDTYGAPLTKQLRAGSATITVTTGGDLSLGSLVTTGELNITSGGKIRIDVPIYETTGETTVLASGDIDINEVAANTTTGKDLTMTSTGGDINVFAKVGPWDRETGEILNREALPGGSITLSAAGNINVDTDIASYRDDGTGGPAAIVLNAGTSAVSGTVNLTDGIKVMSDSGTISVTAFDDLANGPYINDDPDPAKVNATPTTGYFTTGALSLTSTNGDLTINQTIPDTTGAVTLNAGDSIYVNQRIYSDNADISLTAGTAAVQRPGWKGGIYMTPQADPLSTDPSKGTVVLSDIDSRLANLYLEAKGEIEVSVLRTGHVLPKPPNKTMEEYLLPGQTESMLETLLQVKSTESTVTGLACEGGICSTYGNILPSRATGDNTSAYPKTLELAGSLGISDFYTGNLSSSIKAISDQGSIVALKVNSPESLEVIAHSDITMSGYLGFAPSLYAGGNINNSSGIVWASDVIEKAGGSITVGSVSNTTLTPTDPPVSGTDDFSFIVSSLNLSAGTNPFLTFSDDYEIAGISVADLKDDWEATGLGNISTSGRIWVEGEGGLVATATGDIDLTRNVHVSYELWGDKPLDPKQAIQPFSLSAGGHINLPERIETMGPVTLISQDGNINIGETLGAHVSVETPQGHLWNPDDKGVASVEITAYNGWISMWEARAEGNIMIKAYGDGVETGYIDFYTAMESTGDVALQEYTYDGDGTPILSHEYSPGTYGPNGYDTAISLAEVDRLPFPLPYIPIVGPGPLMSGPAGPPLPGALPPGAPSVPAVAALDVPAGSGLGAERQFEPERATGEGSLSEVIPEEEEETGEEKEEQKDQEAVKEDVQKKSQEKAEIVLEFSGGRGVSQTAVDNEIRETFIQSPFVPPFSRRR